MNINDFRLLYEYVDVRIVFILFFHRLPNLIFLFINSRRFFILHKISWFYSFQNKILKSSEVEEFYLGTKWNTVHITDFLLLYVDIRFFLLFLNCIPIYCSCLSIPGDLTLFVKHLKLVLQFSKYEVTRVQRLSRSKNILGAQNEMNVNDLLLLQCIWTVELFYLFFYHLPIYCSCLLTLGDLSIYVKHLNCYCFRNINYTGSNPNNFFGAQNNIHVKDLRLIYVDILIHFTLFFLNLPIYYIC